MSIKCEKCNNKVFDSNAYLKMAAYKIEQEDIINEISKTLEDAKNTLGKKSSEYIAINEMLQTEKRILSIMNKFQNTL